MKRVKVKIHVKLFTDTNIIKNNLVSEINVKTNKSS